MATLPSSQSLKGIPTANIAANEFDAKWPRTMVQSPVLTVSLAPSAMEGSGSWDLSCQFNLSQMAPLTPKQTVDPEVRRFEAEP